MSRLLAIDGWLIDLTQDVYLWLWDRTGVYVATLIFAAYVGDHVCWGPLKLVDFFMLAWAGSWSGYLYLSQSKDLRRLNDLQRSWRDFPLRKYFFALGFALVVEQALCLDVWRFTSNALMMVWGYLACVQVRDREPKEFFPSRKLVGAAS